MKGSKIEVSCEPSCRFLIWCFCLFRVYLFPLCTIYQVCIWWHGLSTCLTLFKANCIKEEFVPCTFHFVTNIPVLTLYLFILNLFPWNEKVLVSGVGDWLFVCFTSNHQPKPKALKVPNEGNERRSRSQATKQNKSVGMGGR